MTHFKLVLSGLTVLLIPGCSFHHINFNANPDVAVQEGFVSLEEQAVSNAITEEKWWVSFDRPQLDMLIEQSFDTNQDVAAAISRINQARALRQQTRSDLFPKINGEGNVADSREDNDGQPSTSQAGAALAWEIDVFNRIGSAAKADAYEAIARKEDLEALYLSLSAEIANAYFGAVAAHNRLQLLNQQLKTDQELLELIELRQDSGVGTSVEVLQQQSQVAESLSLVPPAEADLRVFENRLDVLLGIQPDAEHRVKPDDTLRFAHDLPAIGVPADLLFNRPDLRAAKAELIAADAEIASAIAERLPQITLTGSYLYSDTATFSGPVATIMGAFVQPILDWGERKAAVEENKELYKERLALYTQLYLEAVEEVENVLYQERKQREYIERLEERRKILSDTVEETEALYTQGVNDYLPVLNALQDLRVIERDILTERLNLINLRITLHRAIGGATHHSDQKES